MNSLKTFVKPPLKYSIVLIKWLFISALVGAIGGFIGSIFHLNIDYATEIRNHYTWIILFLPLGGIAIAAIYRIFRNKGNIDTNRVLEAVKSEQNVPIVMAPLIFVSTCITHLLGGSAGREGAALQLGGSIGYNTGKLFRLNKDDMHIVVMSGMSAVFSALFGTPLTAAFFALEVTTVGTLHYAALIPCIISAITAFIIAGKFGLPPVRFQNIAPQLISLHLMIKVIILAILCAIVSIIFCTAIKKCEHYLEKLVPNAYFRAFTGALLIIGLTYALGTFDYNGAGMDIIVNAMNGSAKYEAFLLKIVFTAITIAAGFKGGEIVPSFFIGATFGCVVAPFLGLDAAFGATVGFIALFCSVVNCPIASTILALEVFGADSILIMATVCGISYMMSGYYGLYKSQKIAYSKLGYEEANVNTK